MMISKNLSLHLVTLKCNSKRYNESIYTNAPIIKAKNQNHSQNNLTIKCISSNNNDVDVDNPDPIIQVFEIFFYKKIN